MKVLQLNANHCQAAQDLLWQTVAEQSIDIVLLSEPFENIDTHNWLADSNMGAAVWLVGNKTPQCKMSTVRNGFTWIKTDDVFYVSCYAPPRWSIQEFEQMMLELELELRGKRPILLAGDFNAWSRTWGSTHTNQRGRLVENTVAALDLVLLNTPGVYTYDCKKGNSIIDLAFADRLTANTTIWTVDKAIHSHSDHLAIMIQTYSIVRRYKTSVRKWKKSAFNTETFKNAWESVHIDGVNAEILAEQIASQMEASCDATMPRCGVGRHKQAVYWWTDEIASIRRKCLMARRKAQRARRRSSYEDLHASYKARKRDLKLAIQQSKIRSFREMVDAANVDPWGLAYKTVMRKVKGPQSSQPTCPRLLQQVVVTLFPPQKDSDNSADNYELEPNIPSVTTDEVLGTLNRIKDRKAPGPDGIPNAAFKTAVQTKPHLFASLYESCLREGTFPNRWKIQRLVLLLKPGKQPDEPSAYRPLCMLDTVGKVFERIICDRLQAYLECPSGLSDNQYGFRRARSTVDAIRTVTDIAHEAISGGHLHMKYCAIITLDIKNAFNSAKWSNILMSLKELRVPGYLLCIIRSYFTNRILQYDTDGGQKTYQITGGVPQGSVLGPTLWNVMYDGVLKLKLPDGATIVGYADDIALVVTDRNIDHLEAKSNDAAARVRLWLAKSGLELAAQKTEAVLISGRRKKEEIKVRIGTHEISSKASIKYLGVIIDRRLSYKQHLSAVSARADAINGALTRMLPNIGGPQGSRRRVLSTVVDSVLFYAAPIWAGAKSSSIHYAAQVLRRSAIRVACGYRTVSRDAIGVIASKLPADIQAKELSRLYGRRRAKLSLEEKAEERLHSIEEWQIRWDSSTNGRWTHRLISNISQWVTRKHGDVDYYLTQILSGHGCFLEYLHRFNLEDTPFCPNCNNAIENAEHVFFYCDRFREERLTLEAFLGGQLCPENLITKMLASNAWWNAVTNFATMIGLYLERAGWQRNMQRRIHQQLLTGGRLPTN